MHVFSQNTVNTSVFEKVFQKHCKIQHFGHVVAKVSQIAVFWLHLLFGLLRKHRKYQCFGSILGLEEKKTLQIALFCFGRSQKHCKLPVVPHKAVAEVSRIGNYRRDWLL